MSAPYPACDGATIQKNRPRLLVTGLALLAVSGLPLFSAWLWLPGIVAGLAGVCLLFWATAGNGRWCRQGKTVRVSR